MDLSQFEGHTKGPWYGGYYTGKFDEVGIDSTSPRVVSTAPDTAGEGKRWYIAGILQGQQWTAEDEANARLIATAPDLLRELTEARKALRQCLEIAKEGGPFWWEKINRICEGAGITIEGEG